MITASEMFSVLLVCLDESEWEGGAPPIQH